ncbi:hypothetical protein [Kaarinaea lacus]
MRVKSVVVTGAVLSIMLVIWQTSAFAGRVADIQNTKHNFSASPLYPNTLPTGQQRVVRATDEEQICVFCHTPHAAETSVGPLWNRQLSNANYQTYVSGSLDSGRPGLNPNLQAQALQQPNGVSKLCLSCHDGTLAIGAVNVLWGTFTDQDGTTEDIAMQGTGPGGTMAPGEGATTGFTRNLGTNLTNDHPISVRYDANLAAVDGEMRFPNVEDDIIVRSVDPWPPTQGQRTRTEYIHLEPDAGTNTGGLVQCNSCHDPHIRSTDPTENIKFLRLNRFQKVQPQEGQFNPNNDIICLACHDKAGWVGSAHAHPNVADETYTTAAAEVREFPTSGNGTQVWESACLACHDTHTVQGSRRLLREGTDGGIMTSSSGYRIKTGNGQPAIEETCYACHSADGNTLIGQGTGNFQVPDIKTDFTTMRTHMPISNSDQPAGQEMHDIGSPNPDVQDPNGLGKDFIENPANMGRGNLTNRHAECTNCHNPHRVTKNRQFNMDPFVPNAAGTHNHAQPHNNLASGVLRGIWGVEPVYGGTAFMTIPVSFDVKRGSPGIGASTAINAPHVTREYQVCLKCHSNYGYNDQNNNFGTTPLRPQLGTFTGGTPPGTNDLTIYTNQAMEYQSPADHMGEGTSGSATGAAGAYAANNHRSWHPVMRQTGRSSGVRGGADPTNWRTPFQTIGTQTMYCTDCHGSDTDTANDGVVPRPKAGGGSNEDGFPWGPHGSINDFLLKGEWSGNRTTDTDGTGNLGTGDAGSENHLCFKCHEYNQYGQAGLGGGMGGMGGGATAQTSGFATPACGGGCMGGPINNLHVYHTGVVATWRCNLCHVAIPHGWKNKNFLVNLNDVGPEGGEAPGTQLRNGAGGGGMGGMGGGGGATGAFTRGPYYNRAALKIVNFAVSGQWSPNDCGSAGAPGNGAVGVNWMFMSSEACNNLP